MLRRLCLQGRVLSFEPCDLLLDGLAGRHGLVSCRRAARWRFPFRQVHHTMARRLESPPRAPDLAPLALVTRAYIRIYLLRERLKTA
jgi:hypothetical protein